MPLSFVPLATARDMLGAMRHSQLMNLDFTMIREIHLGDNNIRCWTVTQNSVPDNSVANILSRRQNVTLVKNIVTGQFRVEFDENSITYLVLPVLAVLIILGLVLVLSLAYTLCSQTPSSS